jgi:DNA end-binding protein Ku
MPRAIWSGAISFGLVNIPVKAFSATRDHKVHFHQLDKKTGSRIRYEKVADKTGKKVASDDIELGYEVERGKYVTAEPEEIEELRPESTRTIEISDFVDLNEVDPVFYKNTYWLAPDGQGADAAYRLLLSAMEDAGRVGIGEVVMRNTQYLAAIRPRDHALAMSTMRFADEVLDRRDIDGIPSKAGKIDSKQRNLAMQIIDSLSSSWNPKQYRDTYTDEVEDLLRRKAKGEQIVTEPTEEAPAKVVDLMEALQASIDQGKKRRPASKSRARPSKSRSRTKKSA